MDETGACILDIGVNNLIALTTNLGTPPVLIRGRNLKSKNQWMNKKIAELFNEHTLSVENMVLNPISIEI